MMGGSWWPCLPSPDGPSLAGTAGRWGGAILAAGGVGIAARRKRVLTRDGAVAATAVGAVVLARGGLAAGAALVAFFVTSSAMTRFKEARFIEGEEGEQARQGTLAQAKGGERDAWQVLANGAVAGACLALSGRRGIGGFLGALATAGADTWATELGLLASRSPRLLTTLRPVPPGTSGAVSAAGTLASVGGAVTVGAVWTVVRRLQGHQPGTGAVFLAGVAGTMGALIDSLLGATVQANGWCPRCHVPTEEAVHARCGSPTAHVRGWQWMDNDAVNALATGAGAVVGGAFSHALLPPAHRRGPVVCSGP